LKTKKSLLIALIIISILISACSNNITSSNNDVPPSNTISEDHFSFGAEGASKIENPTSEQMLIFAIQDEYLARTEYDHIINEFGAQTPFTNIIKAEVKHIDMLKLLFEEYNTDIPQDNSSDYIVYPKTITEGLETGVTAEINNIAMYEKFLAQNISDDIREVFEKLMNASKNHLEAFKRKLDRQ
jgi:hypothetical protein